MPRLSAEAAGAEHQGVGFLDEEQLAQEEEVERQQVAAAVHRMVGVLLEGQGDVEAQAVLSPAPSWAAAMMPPPAPVITIRS